MYYALVVVRLTPAVAVVGSVLGMLAAGCLPGDERPAPASVELAVEAAETSSAGFVSDDGWQIDLDRLLAALGTVRLEGETCNAYNDAWYSRVFDFARPLDEPTKVALVHGIGDCRLEFRLRSPQDDSILGEGVSEAEVDVMRVESDDAWIDEPQRVSVLVRGSATKDGRTLGFDWSFRKRYDIADCMAPEGGGRSPSDLDLQSDAALERTAEVEASALFRVPAPLPPGHDEDEVLTEDPAAGVPTRFEMFANADSGENGDGDGRVTLEELMHIDANTGETFPTGAGHLGPPDGQAPQGVRPLADVLYDRMVPAIVRLEGSPCLAEVDDD